MSAARTYLDHNATAPLRPEARAAMIAALDLVGNASSVHAEGRRARAVVEDAREQVAALVGAKPEEVVFTSGATEANNWVVRAGWHTLFVGATEHESVLSPAVAAHSHTVVLPCDADGQLNCEALTSHFSSPVVRSTLPRDAGKVARSAGGGPECSTERAHPNPLPVKGRGTGSASGLVSSQLANAETGVLQRLERVIASARQQGLLVHSDAVQTIGRMPVDFRALGLDLMSISGHKLGGPKGVGALVIRDGLDLPPLLAGGGQERRRRSGTENVAGIAGFGAAAKAAKAGLADMTRVALLRDRLEAEVRTITPRVVIIGADVARLPNTSCIALPGADAATLLIKLDLAGIAVSAGSACSSGKIGGSHVLAAMGLPDEVARSAIRVSLGTTTTSADIANLIAAWSELHRPRRTTAHPASAQTRPLVTTTAGE